MKREERDVEIDLLQLLLALWANVKYIVLVTFIAGLIGLIVSTTMMTPIYEASAKMIVNTRKDDTQNITNDQLNSAKNLVNTYAIIIRSRDVLNQVIADLGLTENYGQLADCISVAAVNNTQIMEITVQHKSPDTAFAIAEKILEITPDFIVETVEAGSVKPVEQPHASKDPVSPSIPKNTVLAALIGFLLSCVVIVVIALSDNTYKTDMDIQNDLDLPVLGVIPAIESCSSHRGYERKKKERG